MFRDKGIVGASYDFFIEFEKKEDATVGDFKDAYAREVLIKQIYGGNEFLEPVFRRWLDKRICKGLDDNMKVSPELCDMLNKGTILFSSDLKEAVHSVLLRIQQKVPEPAASRQSIGELVKDYYKLIRQTFVERFGKNVVYGGKFFGKGIVYSGFCKWLVYDHFINHFVDYFKHIC